jgi:hypothetical protein
MRHRHTVPVHRTDHGPATQRGAPESTAFTTTGAAEN